MEEQEKKIEIVPVNEAEAIDVDLMKIEYEGMKYDLPSFDKLLEDFDIEKSFEKETSFLLREIRKIMSEKMGAYLQFFETLMNPVSPPMFVLSALRNLDSDDSLKIKELYKLLAKYQLRGIKLDTIYSEADEAGFVNDVFNEWQKMKKDVYGIVEKLEVDGDNKSGSGGRGYLG